MCRYFNGYELIYDQMKCLYNKKGGDEKHSLQSTKKNAVADVDRLRQLSMSKSPKVQSVNVDI